MQRNRPTRRARDRSVLERVGIWRRTGPCLNGGRPGTSRNTELQVAFAATTLYRVLPPPMIPLHLSSHRCVERMAQLLNESPGRQRQPARPEGPTGSPVTKKRLEPRFGGEKPAFKRESPRYFG